ncbi:hypothetical protein ACFQ3R_14650 [Mesonia ostreae]|uniref:DUF3592 domain-containing protein n=1 Tax=Mesonia ostreae TaxID=861110 RepID=A0ABU2KMF5_9FLAO|nr:hypothetical protein [Mesonia ostreae]MDT0295885.1 hypothetical protein [Mesonia ostreae]
MNNTPRKVKFSTIINILKKKPISIIFGFGFTVFPLFIATILLIIFSSLGNETPKVDYELISSQGKEITAEIIDIETQYNVTINGVHPTIISYQYSENGKETESKYKVLEERKIEKLEIGNSLQIKELNGNSIVKGLKPYDFQVGFLLLFPIPFLIIGLPFLIYSIRNLKKEVKLYKFGKVFKGKIVSMIPKSGLPISNVGQGIIVHYEYETISGKKIIGESFTTDFSIMSDKRKDDFVPIFVSAENKEKSCVVPKLQSLRNNWNIEFE